MKTSLPALVSIFLPQHQLKSVQKSKKGRRLAFLSFCVLLFFYHQTNAQYSYKVIGSNNDTTVYSITSDFPIKPNTGDLVLDQSNFITSFKLWNQNNMVINAIVLPVLGDSGVLDVFFEITEEGLLSFSEERKSAILSNPKLYRIKN